MFTENRIWEANWVWDVIQPKAGMITEFTQKMLDFCATRLLSVQAIIRNAAIPLSEYRGYRRILRSVIFFPILVSTITVGIVLSVMKHPSQGGINVALAFFGIQGPDWLGDTSNAQLFSLYCSQ